MLLSGPGPDLPRPGVLCLIVAVTGSAPQETGARMWVGRDEFRGTLGGGEFERRVLEEARILLKDPGARPRLKEFPLCKATGQCCGGRVTVFLEPLAPLKSVHLFGAGHVGSAAAEVLAGMPFAVSVVDPRPDWADPGRFPEGIRVVRSDHPDYARSRDWGPADAACIFTHSHAADFALVEFFLPLPIGYLGLIGSEHKARVFRSRLQGRTSPNGTPLEELWDEKVRCPMGAPLPGKNPKVIAVSLAAELLKEWALTGAPEEPARSAA